jgi:tetratricopeptide repeat protein
LLAPVRAALVAALLLVGLGQARAEDLDDLERGVALFNRGDLRAAIPYLEKARAADPADGDTALLLGVAYYRTGRGADARPLLEAAARSTDAETAAGASEVLGLLDAPARDDDDSPLTLYLLVRPELDSNVALLPTAIVAESMGSAADAALLALGSGEACLGARERFCLGDTVWTRRQAQLTDYDMLANVADAGWRHQGDGAEAALAYSFELAARGGSRFAIGHVADAAFRKRLGGAWWLATAARFAHRTYDTDDYAPLSGPAIDGLLGLRWVGRRLEAQLGYTPLREWARDPDLSATGHGARLNGRLRALHWLTLEAAAAAVDRAYDGGRHDVQLTGSMEVTLALGDHVGLLAGGSALRNLSSSADADVAKLTAYLGLDVTLAGP